MYVVWSAMGRPCRVIMLSDIVEYQTFLGTVGRREVQEFNFEIDYLQSF